MSNVVMQMQPATPVTVTRKKRRLAWRTLQRRLIRNARYALKCLVRMDLRENQKGEQDGYNPRLFVKRYRSVEDNALNRIIARCEEALAEEA